MPAATIYDTSDSTPAARDVRPDRAMAAWLLGCCAMVFAMVVLGGLTRLTGSGLSMVAWEPLAGVLPPLDAAAWEAEFARYRESPEFMIVNGWMTVDDFKGIYWLEWGHRLLGRMIGLAFAIPFVYFVVRRRVDVALGTKLVGLFVLGGLQGLLGWYMVKSGLVDDPRVSQYRLAAHLALAVAIYAAMLWVALELWNRGDTARRARVATPALAIAALVFVTLSSGALVAGLEAGHIYNTFPKMGGDWLAPGAYALEPAWINAFENPAAAQFNHRVLATTVLVSTLALWIHGLGTGVAPGERRWLHGAALVVLLQYGLGIATLLGGVPLALGAAHQTVALVLLTVLIRLGRARAHEPIPAG